MDVVEDRRRARRRSLALIGVAVSMLLAIVWLLLRSPSGVDLELYLAPVKAASLGDSSERLAQPIPGFHAVSLTNEPRLPEYRTVRGYRRGALEQVVYDRADGGRIVLISAPGDMRFLYDPGPGVATYAFFAGGRHCILVCKACTADQAGDVMRKLGAYDRNK